MNNLHGEHAKLLPELDLTAVITALSRLHRVDEYATFDNQYSAIDKQLAVEQT